MKKLFCTLAIIGIFLITIMAFEIPKNPFEMVPSTLSFDKPLWFCIAFFGSFLYIIILGIIYNKVKTLKKDQ